MLLEMALAREAIAHGLRDAADAGLDVAAMRSAPAILITGRVAYLPISGQSLLVFVDGLEPSAVATVYREPDEGGAERIALVVPVVTRGPRRSESSARPAAAWHGWSPERSVSCRSARTSTLRSTVRHARSRTVGRLGLLIDARGRPLSFPSATSSAFPRWPGGTRRCGDRRRKPNVTWRRERGRRAPLPIGVTKRAEIGDSCARATSSRPAQRSRARSVYRPRDVLASRRPISIASCAYVSGATSLPERSLRGSGDDLLGA